MSWRGARRAPALAAVLLALAPACAMTRRDIPLLATAQVAWDFETYRIQRIGLMPVVAADLGGESSSDLQDSFYTEVSTQTPFELVRLGAGDLDEVVHSEPYRRGTYLPRTIIEIARRYRLDAILFGTVTQRQFFAPQRLSVQMDLVSAETGLVIWSASVHLDAADTRVREGLALWSGASDEDDDAWEVALVSPTRFARFAAWQIARLL